MKKILALVIGIIIFFNLNTFASTRDTKNLRQQMLEYESKKAPIEHELAKTQVKMYLVTSRYGESFSRMDEETLRAFIEIQKKYFLQKEQLAEELNHIYIPQYVPHKSSIDDELKSVLGKLAKQCNILSKITSRCLNKKEVLIFQAEYLKQRIEDLETTQTGLIYEINSIIVQDDVQKGAQKNL